MKRLEIRKTRLLYLAPQLVPNISSLRQAGKCFCDLRLDPTDYRYMNPF